MHIVITKNEDGSWKNVFEFTFKTDVRKNILDAALASSLPITVMETTSFKNLARSGAVWNGESFSGGAPADGENYMDLPSDEDYWSIRKSYSFICDNVIIAMIIANNELPLGQFLNEHLNKNEVKLIKLPDDKKILVGEDFQYDVSTNTVL